MGAVMRLACGPNPVLHLTAVKGDLVLQGWPQSTIVISGGAEEIAGDQDETTIRLICLDDCVIQAPQDAVIRIDHIGGDARIHHLTDSLEIKVIRGDLSLQNVGPIRIEEIGGDLSAHQVAGDLAIVAMRGDASIVNVTGFCRLTAVEGDLSVHQVGGDLTVDAVRGDASISNVTGVCRLAAVENDLALTNVTGDVEATAGDDVSLRVALRPGVRCTVRAGGDVSCRIPPASDVAVSLVAGESLSVKRLDVDDSTALTRNFTLGTGAATLSLTAGESLTLVGSDTGWEPGGMAGAEFSLRAAEFANQIAGHVEKLTRKLDEKLTQLANDEEVSIRIQDRVQAAVRMAETKIADVMRQAERRAQEADRRAGQGEARARQKNWAPPVPPTPPKPPKPPRPVFSDEERMMVLRMVEEGKISVEQAEQLLAALRPKEK